VSQLRVLARTVKGLEGLLADQLTKHKVGVIERHRPREVLFRTGHGLGEAWPGLRVADDAFVVAGPITDVGPHKSSLTRLASRLDPDRIRAVASAGPATGGWKTGPGPVDVVASVAGPHNYSRYDVEEQVGAELGRILGRAYASRRRGFPDPGLAAMSWRVSIIDGQAVVGLRWSTRPLHRRAYREATVPGALHPPVAAAMAAITGVRCGVLLDPFCGSGTILIEAGLQAPLLHLVGCDLDPAALSVAAGNASRAGVGVTLMRCDSARPPMAAGSADVILANPPWGIQARAGGKLSAPPSLARLVDALRPGGVLAIADDHQETGTYLSRRGLDLAQDLPISLHGRHPRIQLWVQLF
jgi:tRNA (guanine6-N2)-methyltransferase